jgi:autotransporter-associated beta strand protein
MKTLIRFLAVLAVALSAASSARAETVLIDFGNALSNRGASQNGTDSNGYSWTSIYSGAYYGSLVDISNSATTLGIGFATSTGLGTDSYNGPSGVTSAPITQPQIDAANINAAALGILGGSKASAFDFYNATDGRFVIQGLNVNETYNLTFFGSHMYSAVNTTDYGVYTDGNYTTSVGSASLNVGVGGNNNTGNTTTIAGVTPQTSNTLYVRFGASGYTANGYINELSIVGYVPYADGTTHTLSAAKSYPGNTILGNATTVAANATGALGGGTSALQVDAGGGTLSLGANQTVTALIGSGNLALTTGSNALTISTGGNTTFSVLAGSNGNFANNDYTGVLSGSGTIIKAGSGTQILSNANTFNGTVKNSAGTLTLNNVNALQNATLDTLYGASGTLAFGVSGNNTYKLGDLYGNRAIDMGGNSLNFSMAKASTFYDGVLSGTGGITKSGSYTLTLRGNNTFTGAVTISTGTLQISDDGPAGGGTIGTSSGITVNGLLAYNLTSNNRTYSNVIAGTGALHKLGANTTLTLTGNNSYSGTTSIVAGTLQVGAGTDAGTIGSTSAITNNGSLVYNVGNGARTLGAVISGNGSLTQNSAGGSLTLSGNNTYTGTTTISAGTLVLASGGDIVSSTGVNLGTAGSRGTLDLTAKSAYTFGVGVTVNGDGTINIGGGRAVTIAGNFAPGNSPGIVNVTGDLSLGSTSNTTMELAGNGGVKGTDFDNSTSTGTTTYGGALSIVSFGGYDINANHVTYRLFDFSAYASNFTSVAVAGTSLSPSGTLWSGTNSGTLYTFDIATGDLTVVPEPATWALLAFSLTTVMVLRRRRD